MRVIRISAILVSALTLSGCLFDPYAKQVQQVGLQVASLEQRVNGVEVSRAGALASNQLSGAAGTSASLVTAAPFAGSPSSEALAGTGAGSAAATAGRGRFPFFPFDVRRALGKLGRGVVNVMTGWVEVPKRVHETSQTSGAGAGLTWGFLRGMGHGFIRSVGGAYEVVTFPFPAPPGYRPVIRPEFVFTCDEAE